MYSFQPFVLTLTGILLITVIDAAGAILSRKMNFNFSAFTFISIGVYILIGYLAATSKGLYSALISTLIMGIYDAIIGWELSKKLNANFGEFKEEIENLSVHIRVAGSVLLSLFLGLIGYWLS